MFLKKGKFYGVTYADHISELDFYGKNLSYQIKGNELLFSFQLMNLLDKKKIISHIYDLQFVEIEDIFITQKIIRILNDNAFVNTIFLDLETNSFKLKKMKVKLKGICFQIN